MVYGCTSASKTFIDGISLNCHHIFCEVSREQHGTVFVSALYYVERLCNYCKGKVRVTLHFMLSLFNTLVLLSASSLENHPIVGRG
jgi:hypothetical protein